MSSQNADTLKAILHDIADAIRYKRGTNVPIPMQDMETEILNIETDSFFEFDTNASIASNASSETSAISVTIDSLNIESSVSVS